MGPVSREVTEMALNLAEKQAIVDEVATIAAKAHSAVAAEYRGLTVAEMSQLRAAARKAGVYLRVVKNTLARRAVEGTGFSCMQEGMKGPLVFAFSMKEPGAAARVIEDFSKGKDKLVVRLVSIGGKLLDPRDISVLAKMPTYDEAISQLMALMKAPVQKLARTLQEVPGKLVRTLAAVRDAKETG
ncbi:50S ribosomal subunit protein L10 [Gammaproteobacteria bacterium]